MKKDWNAIKVGECPICRSKLERNGNMWHCTDLEGTGCDFKISEYRRVGMVRDMDWKKFDEEHSEDKNFEALQRL